MGREGTITVEAQALRRALDRLLGVQAGRPRARPIWRFAPDALEIRSGGAAVTLDARGDAELTLSLPAHALEALRDELADSDEIAMEVRCDALVVDGFTLRGHTVFGGGDALVPVDARPIHLLGLRDRHTPPEIANAGLTALCEETERRLATTLEKVAKKLAWAEIDADLLSAWIHRHAAAVAAGERSFELPDPI